MTANIYISNSLKGVRARQSMVEVTNRTTLRFVKSSSKKWVHVASAVPVTAAFETERPGN